MYIIETVAFSEPSGVIIHVEEFERSGLADTSSSSSSSSIKSGDPPASSPRKTPVLKAPLSTPVTPVVPVPDPLVPSLDSPLKSGAERVVSDSSLHRNVVGRLSATPSLEKNTKNDSDPLILEMEVEELSDKVQGVVEQQERMDTALSEMQETQNKMLETQHALLSRQGEICDRLYRLDHQLQRLDYWRYSSSRPLETSSATPSPLDLQLPPQSPTDKFLLYGSTPKRSLAGRHFLPPSQEKNTCSSGAFNPHSSSFSFGTGQEPITPTQPSSKETPLPLPFNSSNVNVLDASEIAKSNAALIPISAVLAKHPKLRCESKVATLAVKLAREALFGDDVLSRCTVSGERAYPGLPVDKVNELKAAIFQQFPQYWTTKHEFEPLWKSCMESVGQACKRLRSKQLCKPDLNKQTG